jgi:hypothetical protein
MSGSILADGKVPQLEQRQLARRKGQQRICQLQATAHHATAMAEGQSQHQLLEEEAGQGLGYPAHPQAVQQYRQYSQQYRQYRQAGAYQ